jgi:DNA repair exonuclease SbcCD nuclease subunit
LALRALVDLCLAEGAQLLLCVGDIIDGWCRDHRVGLVFVQELLRLREVGCEVALLLGNHDVRTRVMRPLLLPDNARVLGERGPETWLLERLGTALHAWSVPAPDHEVDVASLYPPPVPGLLNVGLLHTSAEGRRGHAEYAPCSRRTLRRHGYDYWALGHVHAREVIAREPWIVFPGNLQARGSREAGPKGATLVRVRRGRILSAEHRALDAVRFETVLADTSSLEHFDDVLARAQLALDRALHEADGRPLVARLILSGVDGAARTLAVPPGERRAAFGELARHLRRDVWLDETWILVGGVGAWQIGAAA